MLDEKFEGLDAWMKGSTTGASSKAIAHYLSGECISDGDYPRDAEDFDRCELLLRTVPSLRVAFEAEMANASQYWAALVPQWEVIKAQDNRTAAIRKIIKPLQDADANHFQLGDHASFRVHTPGNPMTDKIAGALKSSGIPMKQTPADEKVIDNAYRVTADELRQFIERFERLQAEKDDISEQQREVMGEAKGRGYDTKVLRKVIALRKRDKDDIAEEEAILDMYKEALGM